MAMYDTIRLSKCRVSYRDKSGIQHRIVNATVTHLGSGLVRIQGTERNFETLYDYPMGGVPEDWPTFEETDTFTWLSDPLDRLIHGPTRVRTCLKTNRELPSTTFDKVVHADRIEGTFE